MSVRHSNAVIRICDEILLEEIQRFSRVAEDYSNDRFVDDEIARWIDFRISSRSHEDVARAVGHSCSREAGSDQHLCFARLEGPVFFRRDFL